MDEGTDARDVLENKLLPLRRGVAVWEAGGPGVGQREATGPGRRIWRATGPGEDRKSRWGGAGEPVHLCFFKTKFVFVLITETSADAPRYIFPSPFPHCLEVTAFLHHCKPF